MGVMLILPGITQAGHMAGPKALLAELPAPAAPTFPNHPVIPTKPAVFDDSELLRKSPWTRAFEAAAAALARMWPKTP
jgi:hypothetical protein